jgi:predicted O-methyltransferase YrrM
MVSPTYPEVQWIGEDRLRVGGVEMLVTDDSDVYRTTTSDDERFLLVKDPRNLERALDRYRRLAPTNVVELGVYQGGSAVFWNLTLRPARHLALDRSPLRIAPLDTFVEGDRHHGDLRLALGVDQSDVAAVTAMVDDMFGDEGLDLVIDDCSHFYGETRTSFEVLFPRVRPGGVYVIEDWAWSHSSSPKTDDLGVLRDRPALTNLVVEVLMAAGTRPDAIEHVRVDHFSAEIIRGPAELASPVALAELYHNRGLPFRALL